MSSAYFVRNREAIMDYTLEQLGRPDLRAQIHGEGVFGTAVPPGADFTRLVGEDCRFPGNTARYHAVLGDGSASPV